MQKNRIHGKPGQHLRTLLVTTPCAPEWTESPLIDQAASHTTRPSPQTCMPQTARRSLHFDCRTTRTATKRVALQESPPKKPPPTSPLIAALKEIFPRQRQTKEKKKNQKTARANFSKGSPISNRKKSPSSTRSSSPNKKAWQKSGPTRREPLTLGRARRRSPLFHIAHKAHCA
jgi:hypothetical protein